MPGRVGRPLKYAYLLKQLANDTLYSPASIARYGEIAGYLPMSLPPEIIQQRRLRIRHTLARYKANHDFPLEGDGHVELEGQPPVRAWLGSRWKERLHQENHPPSLDDMI